MCLKDTVGKRCIVLDANRMEPCYHWEWEGEGQGMT